ncbi:uncharacterized protein [Panulirus ornatus]|uniref:uncharacterized protein n=1 Tax=Panulirus ornatus TaxID=150431 RepID=UPI003A84B92A
MRLPKATWVKFLVLIAASLTQSSFGQECQDIQSSSEGSPLVLSFSRGTVWFRPQDPKTHDLWTASFYLGREEGDGTFTRDYELQLKKPKDKNFLACKFFQAGTRKSFLDERFSRDWLASGMWVGLGLSKSQLSLTFQGQGQLQLQLTAEKDEEFEGVEDVKLTGAMEATVNCPRPEDDTTTIPPTTTSASTTTTTTATTTTEEPSTTVTYDSTSSDQDTLTGATDLGNTTASSSDVEFDSQVEDPDDGKCVEVIPWWVWVCAGLTVSFIVFFLLLLPYTIVLHRRNWNLTTTLVRQGQSLRGRTGIPGGYCVQASDVQFYEMRNHNIMVGDTTPRLVTPSPHPARRCNTAPRLSPYRRSISNPGTPRLYPTIHFPAPPSVERSPSPYLDENYLPPPPDDLDAYIHIDQDNMSGKKSCNYSENALADDERSLNTLDK